jgi:viroplasmin and RNaseH domain-containing protein
MLDKTATEYLSQQAGDDASMPYSQHSHEHSTHDTAREDMLKEREGKSATRTVKQAIAIKHARERRGAGE